MKKYKIYADATADIPQELQKRYHINILPIPVAIGEQSYMSGLEISNDEFYQMMEAHEGIPVTSQITPYEFEQLYQRELAEGTKELLVFLLNSKGSATYGNAVAMRDAFYEQNPDAKQQMNIHLFDGASYSVGYGYTVVITAQRLEMGVDINEALHAAQAQLDKQCLYFGMYSLKYAGKSGRIPSAAVFVGEALGIKPIMRLGDHAIVTAGKARGEKKLIKEIVKMVTADMQPHTPYCLVYGNDETVRDEMSAEMTQKVGYPPVYTFQIGPAVAANAGPRIVGVSFELKAKKLQKADKA